MATNVTPTPIPTGSFVEWSAVFAGAVLACATSLVLTHFGQGLGFTYEALSDETPNWQGRLLIAGLWMLWVQLMASMGGAYLAGRMRAPVSTGHESEVRDGAHGLLVWATSTLMVVVAVTVAGYLAVLGGADANDTPRFSEEMTDRIGLVWNFSIAASSIVSAAAAWWMGTLGGDHRDSAIDASRYISFRRRTTTSTAATSAVKKK